MIGFFDKLYPAGHLSIDRIARISGDLPPREGVQSRTRRITMDDGTSVDLAASQVESLLERPVQMLPAEPGTQRVRIGVEGGELWVALDSLIAWALCLDGEIRIVTASGVNDGVSEPQQGFFVEMPDGKVRGVGGYTEPVEYDSLNDMVRTIAAEHGVDVPQEYAL